MNFRRRAPGTILQEMFVVPKLGNLTGLKIVEIGPGNGDWLHIFLAKGADCVAIEQDLEAFQNLESRFPDEISLGRLTLINASFIVAPEILQKSIADILFFSMLLDYLTEQEEDAVFEVAKNVLKPGGRLIGLFPSSVKDWSVEDDLCGHFRRYSRASIMTLLDRNSFEPRCIRGLTFPLSNFLLPISNFIVSKNEGANALLSVYERTSKSGRRSVPFKTEFPWWTAVVLNRLVLLPFHLLQLIYNNHNRNLVHFVSASESSKRETLGNIPPEKRCSE